MPSPCKACSQSKHRFLEPALGRAAARGWQPTSSGTLLAAVIPRWPRVREQKALPAPSVWSGAGLSLARKATSQAHVSAAGIASPPPRASVFRGKTLVPNHPQTSGQASCCPIVSPWALEAAFFTLCFPNGCPRLFAHARVPNLQHLGLGLLPRSQHQPGCRSRYMQNSPSKGHNSQTRNSLKNPQWLLREPRSQTSPFYCAKHTDFHPKSKVCTRALPVSNPALTAPAGNTPPKTSTPQKQKDSGPRAIFILPRIF